MKKSNRKAAQLGYASGEEISRGFAWYLIAAAAVMFSIGWYMLKFEHEAYFMSTMTRSNSQRVAMVVICFLGSAFCFVYSAHELRRRR